jgi:S-adenosylmethionine:tRNA ribosyltransferase-isomerase
LNLSDFDFELPESLIAQNPPARRDAARMLVLHRDSGTWEDRQFSDLPSYLRAGDCLVLNDSKVIPSRLFGEKVGAPGKVEIFLLKRTGKDAEWKALVRPGRKLMPGDTIRFDGDLEAYITQWGEFGERTIRFQGSDSIEEAIERIGHMPLPPYIKRPDAAADRERYQTIFAREKGSVAAPTAGLHFTPEVLARCHTAGADIAYVTLHVGLGTFQPLRMESVEENRLHEEAYIVTPEANAKIAHAERVVACGTTCVRTLESAALKGPAGQTDLLIRPGFDFRTTGAMLTNFHLPRTSLLLLVCAFGGMEFVLSAYRHAVSAGYRFYSYGDCMLIV